jgi:hypothetical protein
VVGILEMVTADKEQSRAWAVAVAAGCLDVVGASALQASALWPLADGCTHTAGGDTTQLQLGPGIGRQEAGQAI